jgi:phosphoglycerate dehydrogenase-like enzyme
MQKILVAVDDFTEGHLTRIRMGVQQWAVVETLPQSAPVSEYLARLQDKDAIVGWPQPELLHSTPVKLLQIGSSGWDSYEGKGLESCGIMLCTAKGVYSIGVAEHCLAMMFALTRRLQRHVLDKQQKVFCRHPPYGEVTGATACIVGLGQIGLELASRCRGIQMRVIGVAREPSRAYPNIDHVFPLDALELAIHEADHVFMTASGGSANRNLFSRKVLESIRSTAYFYNISRGSIVDEAALCQLLAQGRIAGAGLDVTSTEPLPADSPLWELGDNVLMTGHSAGISANFPNRFCDLAVNNLVHFYRGEPLVNRVI